MLSPMFAMTGCFSMWANSWGHPSPGEQVELFLLDVVTLPAQILFAAGAGLDALRQKRERNAQEREIAKEAERLRQNPEIIRDDPAFLDQWNHIRASALARLVADPSMSFSEEQLLAIESIWTRQNRLISQGRGGWCAPCAGLWLRPEWSPENLEKGLMNLQRENVSGMRAVEWRDYASSTNVTDACLHLMQARGDGTARANLASRIVRDDAWRATLRERYRLTEWDPPATNLVTQGQVDGVLYDLEHRAWFSADVAIEVLPSPAEARELLLEKCGEHNTRCALVCRFPGDTAIGERCYSDMTGHQPNFVAFARANVLVVATKTDGCTSEALRASDWVDRQLCQRMGIARHGTTDVVSMDDLRDMVVFGRNREADIRKRKNEGAMRLAADSAAFIAKIRELCPAFDGHIALWGLRYVYGWDDSGRLTIEQVGQEFAGGASPEYLLSVARDLLEGRRTGLENATPEERDRFHRNAISFAMAAGVNEYVWEMIGRAGDR